MQGWSPQQIPARLRVDFPDDEFIRISHQAIYQAHCVQSRGGLKRELVACLRTGRALRVSRARSKQKAWPHVTADALISDHASESLAGKSACHRSVRVRPPMQPSAAR